MLIDLERNDLGRVCVPGSVRVDELMAVESYAHVHHIVSNVRGELRAGVGPGRCWRRCSPAAPSPAARRCAACRSSPSSKARAAALHRRARLPRPRRRHGPQHPHPQRLAGGHAGAAARRRGLVVDSIPEAELEETRAKARGLLRALGEP
jgi:anthranilate synthase component 1